MARISRKTRKRLHRLLDDSIDKCNRPKNIVKPHWFEQSFAKLYTHLECERHELYYELFEVFNFEAAEDEAYDNINLAIMILDKLRHDKKFTKAKIWSRPKL